MFSRTLLTMLIGLAAFAALAADPLQPPPLVVAHRGLLLHAPENTLPNFRACLELGLGFEFDVRRTRDGHLVCLHDATVDRTTNARGKLADLTLAQLQSLDAGDWFDARFRGEQVPTIEDVLSLVRKHRDKPVLIAVDLKDADTDIEADLVKLAGKLQVLDKLLFIGRAIDSPEVRARLRKASPHAHVASLANRPDEFARALADPDADWVYLRYLPTNEEVQQVHNQRKRVFIAGPTVAGNLPDNWQQAISVGVDALLTDFPLDLAGEMRPKR
jgi:glycerophosphoryl diester phosphodiesterase